MSVTEIDMYEDYKHPDLQYTSGRSVELDIFVPKLNLAIEYQGAQHYHNIYSWTDQRVHADRDREKQELCKEVHFSNLQALTCTFRKK